MGKLDLIISISSQIAIENDKPILIFSMKYSGEKITRKFTCLLSSLNSQSLLRGLMKDSEWVRLTQAASRLGDAPIFIDDRPIITLSDLVSQTRRINNKNKLGLLVIDDLQHITIEDDSNILSSAPQITRQLRALAKEIQVPLLTSSQLIPEIENRPNKRPQINDFGSWDILADDANVILFPYRDEFYHPSSQSNEGILEVIVAKNDYGSTGFFRLSYSPAVSRLANYSAVEIDE